LTAAQKKQAAEDQAKKDKEEADKPKPKPV
jgi:hypothetical protein